MTIEHIIYDYESYDSYIILQYYNKGFLLVINNSIQKCIAFHSQILIEYRLTKRKFWTISMLWFQTNIENSKKFHIWNLAQIIEFLFYLFLLFNTSMYEKISKILLILNNLIVWDTVLLSYCDSIQFNMKERQKK